MGFIMRDILRNPVFYYLLIPALIAVWPAMLWFTYLPKAQAAQEKEVTQYKEAEKKIEEILILDPDRVIIANVGKDNKEFSYAEAIYEIARACDIPASNCSHSTGAVIKSKERNKQTARITITGISIVKISRFISMMKLRWKNLQCTSLTLTPEKGSSPDKWKADIKFVYYY